MEGEPLADSAIAEHKAGLPADAVAPEAPQTSSETGHERPTVHVEFPVQTVSAVPTSLPIAAPQWQAVGSCLPTLLAQSYVSVGDDIPGSALGAAATAYPSPLPIAMDLMKISLGTVGDALDNMPAMFPISLQQTDSTVRTASALAYSPCGAVLAVGCNDGLLLLVDLATGQTLASIHAHETAVCSLQFSRDATRVVTAGLDSCVRVWSTSTATLAHTLQTPMMPIGVAFAGESRDVFIAVLCLGAPLVCHIPSGALTPLSLQEPGESGGELSTTAASGAVTTQAGATTSAGTPYASYCARATHTHINLLELAAGGKRRRGGLIESEASHTPLVPQVVASLIPTLTATLDDSLPVSSQGASAAETGARVGSMTAMWNSGMTPDTTLHEPARGAGDYVAGQPASKRARIEPLLHADEGSAVAVGRQAGDERMPTSSLNATSGAAPGQFPALWEGVTSPVALQTVHEPRSSPFQTAPLADTEHASVAPNVISSTLTGDALRHPVARNECTDDVVMQHSTDREGVAGGSAPAPSVFSPVPGATAIGEGETGHLDSHSAATAALGLVSKAESTQSMHDGGMTAAAVGTEVVDAGAAVDADTAPAAGPEGEQHASEGEGEGATSDGGNEAQKESASEGRVRQSGPVPRKAARSSTGRSRVGVPKSSTQASIRPTYDSATCVAFATPAGGDSALAHTACTFYVGTGRGMVYTFEMAAAAAAPGSLPVFRQVHAAAMPARSSIQSLQYVRAVCCVGAKQVVVPYLLVSSTARCLYLLSIPELRPISIIADAELSEHGMWRAAGATSDGSCIFVADRGRQRPRVRYLQGMFQMAPETAETREGPQATQVISSATAPDVTLQYRLIHSNSIVFKQTYGLAPAALCMGIHPTEPLIAVGDRAGAVNMWRCHPSTTWTVFAPFLRHAEMLSNTAFKLTEVDERILASEGCVPVDTNKPRTAQTSEGDDVDVSSGWGSVRARCRRPVVPLRFDGLSITGTLARFSKHIPQSWVGAGLAGELPARSTTGLGVHGADVSGGGSSGQGVGGSEEVGVAFMSSTAFLRRAAPWDVDNTDTTTQQTPADAVGGSAGAGSTSVLVTADGAAYVPPSRAAASTAVLHALMAEGARAVVRVTARDLPIHWLPEPDEMHAKEPEKVLEPVDDEGQGEE